ncbi:hypothetical protein D3C86_1905610 [compost metagenome]
MTRPRVELGIAQVRVEIGLHALIAVRVHLGDVARGAALGRGVGATGRRARDAKADLLAKLIPDDGHIDGGQECGAFLNLLLHRLLNGGLHGEGRRRFRHAIQVGDSRPILVEQNAGFVTHGYCSR